MQSCARMRTAVRALTAKGQQGYGLDVRLSSPEPMLRVCNPGRYQEK